ncbi:MAG: hypothetical protein JXR76_11980 [Deltaproteobacteria bacterium]|nr:hypothetical protein [Deltaproteobacteria bacterium]
MTTFTNKLRFLLPAMCLVVVFGGCEDSVTDYSNLTSGDTATSSDTDTMVTGTDNIGIPGTDSDSVLDTDSSSDSASDSAVVTPVATNAVVMTSDYESGAVSVLATGTRSQVGDRLVVHSDTVCRYDAITDNVFLVSRLGSDAVTVLSPKADFAPIQQYSVDPGTNAQDIAVVSAERAYVPRFASADILVVNPLTGAKLGRVDASPYADADGNPEAAQAIYKDGVVYVTLQRLDPSWQTTAYSSVLMIDAASGAVQKEAKLTGKNPTGVLRFNDTLQAFILAETGAYGVLDGGVETLKADGTPSGMIVTEQTLGGDVMDAIVTKPDLGFAVIGVPGADGANTQLVTFNPMTGAKGQILIASEGYAMSFMALLGQKEIWVSDRHFTNSGVRVFDAKTAAELTPAPVNVGLPPAMICFDR